MKIPIKAKIIPIIPIIKGRRDLSFGPTVSSMFPVDSIAIE